MLPSEAEPACSDDAAEGPPAARLVELRYFAGLSVEQAAEALGLPRSTAYAHWAYARASLRVLLDLDAGGSPSWAFPIFFWTDRRRSSHG